MKFHFDAVLRNYRNACACHHRNDRIHHLPPAKSYPLPAQAATPRVRTAENTPERVYPLPGRRTPANGSRSAMMPDLFSPQPAYILMKTSSTSIKHHSSKASTMPKQIIDDTIQLIRNISHSLMPPTLKNFGLESAVNDLFQKIEDGSKREA